MEGFISDKTNILQSAKNCFLFWIRWILSHNPKWIENLNQSLHRLPNILVLLFVAALYGLLTDMALKTF